MTYTEPILTWQAGSLHLVENDNRELLVAVVRADGIDVDVLSSKDVFDVMEACVEFLRAANNSKDT